MAEANNKNIYNANDTLDINELASLNDDITPEFIEQLQSQVSQNANILNGIAESAPISDGDLFEEINPAKETVDEVFQEVKSETIEDEFAKKYKAKINQESDPSSIQEQAAEQIDNEAAQPTQEEKQEQLPVEAVQDTKSENTEIQQVTGEKKTEEIKILTSGNIIEKPASKEQLEYNQSLDYLDNDTKYSKYVIYIDPENTEFIESLTVKERKNLINRILREQDDIAITKRRLGMVQTILKHSLVVIITIAVAIPIIYWIINSSLEASINNYRRSQTIFKTLYKEKGKIKSHRSY